MVTNVRGMLQNAIRDASADSGTGGPQVPIPHFHIVNCVHAYIHGSNSKLNFTQVHFLTTFILIQGFNF